MIQQAEKQLLAAGLLIMAARTGFTRSEMLGMSLRRFITTVKAFLPKET